VYNGNEKYGGFVGAMPSSGRVSAIDFLWKQSGLRLAATKQEVCLIGMSHL